MRDAAKSKDFVFQARDVTGATQKRPFTRDVAQSGDFSFQTKDARKNAHVYRWGKASAAVI